MATRYSKKATKEAIESLKKQSGDERKESLKYYSKKELSLILQELGEIVAKWDAKEDLREKINRAIR
ncbi:hypothetical protein [Crassaminicella profunda]|uniref:hypothetical protein n=1 Tax=Crassaminicella profunda TaxID=1286698 RepID=UPI001CA6514F|nr:hypothetical protein [Crassaminicella profunda]QZY56692.1 hypothetical protein K7H06_07165 [Crassaminicella profunda]